VRPLTDVERFFERVLERPAARLFGARLRPVQVLRRVERAMEVARRVEGRQAVLPDHVRVALDPRDLGALGKPESLAVYLADGALAFARAHGYRLAGRPTVSIHVDPTVPRGDPVVSVEHGAGGGRVDALPAGNEMGTRVFTAPVVEPPRATIDISSRDGTRRVVEIPPTGLTIGRATDNAVAIDDPRISRHHARIAPRGRALVMTDLGSTNGTRVNGVAIREIVLGDGDRIEIGDTTLRVHGG
jgi:hypothetical protein